MNKKIILKNPATIKEFAKTIKRRAELNDVYLDKREKYLTKHNDIFKEIRELFMLDTFEKFDRLLVEDRFVAKSKLKYISTDDDHMLQEFRNCIKKVYSYMINNKYKSLPDLLKNKSIIELYSEIEDIGDVRVWALCRYLKLMKIEFIIDKGDK